MACNLLKHRSFFQLRGRIAQYFIGGLFNRFNRLMPLYLEAMQVPAPPDYYRTLFEDIFTHWNPEFYLAVFNLLVLEHFSKMSKDEAFKLIFKDINIPSITGTPSDKAAITDHYYSLCESIRKSLLTDLTIILQVDTLSEFRKTLPNLREAFNKVVEERHWFTEKSAGNWQNFYFLWSKS